MKYISIDEYLMGRVKLTELSAEIIGNVNTIVPRVNDILEKFCEERKVSSGFRTMKDHKRIYEEKNAKRKAQGLPELPVPMSSRHLIGAAVDIEDADGKLKAWVAKNIEILKDIGLWCEHFDSTPTWVHFQCLPPSSGKRIFLP